MCRAISILKTRINQELIEEYNLQSRTRQWAGCASEKGASEKGASEKGAGEEIVFDFADRAHDPQLPVIHDGRMILCEWGNRGGRVAKLPKTGWCRKDSLEAGKWLWLSPESIVIPAQYGLEKGVWFAISEGIQGIVVRDTTDRPHAYMLTTGASTYYQNMTRHDRMPVLVGESI